MGWILLDYWVLITAEDAEIAEEMEIFCKYGSRTALPGEPPLREEMDLTL
jgi:hypothetical protein